MTLKARTNTTSLFTLALCASGLALQSQKSFAMGAPNPQNPSVTQPPAPVVNKRSFDVNGLVTVNSNYDLPTMSLPKLTPACLKANGFDLIAIDPGHDDTAASTRSDAKVRGGNGKFVILWPKVHEGNLNMVTSLLVEHYLTSNAALSDAQKKEISQMVRLSRYPGERRFGEYELEDGYISSSVGLIDDTVINRRERVNQMLRFNRPYSSSSPKGWSTSEVKNVQERAMFLSIHANSSDFYDEGDFGWMIPPNTTSVPTLTLNFQNALAAGFGSQMFGFLKPSSTDDNNVYSLKNAIYNNYTASQIKKSKHSLNLAMLSASLGTPKTLKILSEGFVMNGKVGHIAQVELNSSSPKLFSVYREGVDVKEYGVSSVYDAYAKSIVAGMANLLT